VVVPATDARGALEQLVLHATRLRIPIVEVEGGSLTPSPVRRASGHRPRGRPAPVRLAEEILA
jgi:hypothetical protein